MQIEPRAPILIPLRKRWHRVRVRWLPALVLITGFGAVAFLWRGHVASLTIVGQAEPVVSDVSCYKPGVLEELNVTRFQRVKAGDPVGKVRVTEPGILASSLAVIQAEIEALRVNLKPVVAQQRNAMDYDQLRLDWMKQRAQWASSRVNLDLAEAEYRRMNALFQDKIVSERVYEQAKAARDRLQKEVEELGKLVAEGETNLQYLQVTNKAEISQVSTDPLLAAIAVQESKLRLTEADLSPRVVKAPIDGIVTTIYHRAGEAVNAGQPIVAIATLSPVRIVGYLRVPLATQPTAGMEVQVRTRRPRREVGKATVTEVGTQLESVPATLLGPINFANIVQGLPLDISLPANLKILPGELVDVTLLPTKR
jgi:membrane fusion protein, multidrug efflux system